MAYAAWSVSAFEQPSTPKWNILGTNDLFFNTQIGASFSSGTTSTVWYEELGRTTLGSGNATISIASFSARKYLRIYAYMVSASSLNIALRFNNDSGANYAYRYETNNAQTAGTGTTNGLIASTTGAFQFYTVIDVVNVAAQAKPAIAHTSVMSDLSSAAPASEIVWNKWANTAAQISRVDLVTTTNTFNTGSQLVVLGHD